MLACLDADVGLLSLSFCLCVFVSCLTDKSWVLLATTAVERILHYACTCFSEFSSYT